MLLQPECESEAETGLSEPLVSTVLATGDAAMGAMRPSPTSERVMGSFFNKARNGSLG